MLKTFQLRAARSVTGLGVREIGLYLGISRTIVSKWEQQLPMEDVKSKITDPNALIFFFKQYNISFPTINSIELNTSKDNTSEHLTRFQLRASRAILNISQEELGSYTKVPSIIINYLEKQKNEIFLNSTRKVVDDLIIKRFFEKNSLLFPNNFSVKITKNFSIIETI